MYVCMQKAVYRRQFLGEKLLSFRACTQSFGTACTSHRAMPSPPPTGPRRRPGICFGGAAVDGEGRHIRGSGLAGLRPASVYHARNPPIPTKGVTEPGPVKTVSRPVFKKKIDRATSKQPGACKRKSSFNRRFSERSAHERPPMPEEVFAEVRPPHASLAREDDWSISTCVPLSLPKPLSGIHSWFQ